MRKYKRTSTFAPETKYFDLAQQFTVGSAADWTGTEVTNSAYIAPDGTTLTAYTESALIPSAVGAGYGQVTGSKYMLKALRCRGNLSATALSDQADMTGPVNVTLALVLDTQPNGAQAQGEDVFTDLGTAAQCNHSFQAMGAGTGGRFKILKRKMFTLQPATAGTDGTNTNSLMMSGTQYSMEMQWPRGLLCNIKTNSAVPAVASLSDNNIFLLAHRDGSAPVVLSGASRAYYSD